MTAVAEAPAPETGGAEKRLLMLPLKKLTIDGGTQGRARLDMDVAGEYADRIKGGDEFPPGVAFADGPHYWLAGGFHTYHAHQKAKRSSMLVEVRLGTRRDAVLYAAGDNWKHGKPRTAEDREHACRLLLADEEWGEWSDREIARQCHVDRNLVGKVRKAMRDEAHERAEKEALERRQAEEAEAGADGVDCQRTDSQPITFDDEPPRRSRKRGGGSRTTNTAGINKGRSPRRGEILLETDPAARRDIGLKAVKLARKLGRAATALGIDAEDLFAWAMGYREEKIDPANLPDPPPAEKGK